MVSGLWHYHVTLLFLPDLFVSHLWLSLLVWHNFSTDTRQDLLLKRVKAVDRVVEEKGCVIVSWCGQ